ncbi:replication initiator protein A [Palleronia caenipelagi]|uniref:Replication initiator protein A n=1 Tax=Palleronia caenipelagi TaxID=2489174 RepID=A0A547PM93_9RHOB|nr:replication initiator protein A [Palleronia caenipelagi]TRD15233.1 replication initiator protein A [Palleronia caenipelagi]
MTKKDGRQPLLPDRYPTPDFFVCDIFDAVPKGDMASMEHPIFSISTKPDLTPREYEKNGVFVQVKPSSDGLATIHDRDVLIYCISQLMAGMNQGEEPSQLVRFRAHDFLKATNRVTSGMGYAGLKASLERLSGTRISTNITTGGQEIFETFGIIERARVVRETRDGRMQEIEIKLSDWVFNAIRSKEVLTLHRDYFRLRKPLERRIYEIARKHCGSKSDWKIRLDTLHEKTGSKSSIREFRRLVTAIADQDANHQHIPDYAVIYDDNEDMVKFINRGGLCRTNDVIAVPLPALDGDVYELARALAPGWDVYVLEQEWRNWSARIVNDGGSLPQNAEKAFLGFCRKRFAEKGSC